MDADGGETMITMMIGIVMMMIMMLIIVMVTVMMMVIVVIVRPTPCMACKRAFGYRRCMIMDTIIFIFIPAFIIIIIGYR